MDSAPERVRTGRGYLHGSSLIGLCSRRHVLAILTDSERVFTPRPADRLVWALGRAAEKHVRSQFIAAQRKQGILGTWSCLCGETKTIGLYQNVDCPRCRTKADNYGELPLFDHNARIVGNPDLPYYRPDTGKLRIKEIKSINKRDFEALTGPIPDHVAQGLIYRRLGAINGLDMDDSIGVVYVCKDYVMRPYKEYNVPVSADSERLLDSMWARAHAIKDWTVGHDAGASPVLPDRLAACASSQSTTAKKCSECGSCFARN